MLIYILISHFNFGTSRFLYIVISHRLYVSLTEIVVNNFKAGDDDVWSITHRNQINRS